MTATTSALTPTADILSQRGKCSDGPGGDIALPLITMFHNESGRQHETGIIALNQRGIVTSVVKDRMHFIASIDAIPKDRDLILAVVEF